MGLLRAGFVSMLGVIAVAACGSDHVGTYVAAGGVAGSTAGSSGEGQGGSSAGRGGSASAGRGGSASAGRGGSATAGQGGTNAGTSGEGGSSGEAGAGGGLGGDGGTDTGGSGGSAGAEPSAPFQSCNGDVGAGMDCGPSADENCCASFTVPGGSFLRSYDAVDHTDQTYAARITSFGLDRFEVTIGRFRNFVDAWSGGWRPSPGSGKHTHLDGGSISGETGWDDAWSILPPTTVSEWNTQLVCSATRAVWTPTADANDKKPVTCVSWIEAYAFCIWDGGFLPTEAEWNYAAAGGSEQRYYPWSNPATNTDVDPSYAVYDCLADGSAGCTLDDVPFVGSRSPKGDGLWGHADLGGSALEWNLDWWVEPYAIDACVDCADLAATEGNRIYRGGSFVDATNVMDTASRWYGGQTGRGYGMGIRCARSE